MSNITPLNPQAVPATKIKPFSVTVEYSESREFESGKAYDFKEFESKAIWVAAANYNGGYDKTGVKVLFEDGSEYGCRLDLGCNGNDSNFMTHCLIILSHYDNLSESEKDSSGFYNTAQYKEMIAFLRKMDFSDTNQDQELAAAKKQIEQKLAEEKAKEEAEKQAAQAAALKAREERAAAEQAFKADLVVPEDAKAVLVAYFTEYDTDKSDPYSDYHVNKTNKVVLLAWSKHNRDLFSEMRKAAKNHPDTVYLSDKENSKEHREKWSMGDGYYLTDNDYIRAGLKIRKVRLYGDDKAASVPMGEIAIPAYKGKTASEPAPQPQVKAEPAPEQQPQVKAEPTPEQKPRVKPTFKAVKRGGLWSVFITEGANTAEYNDIEAANISQAIRLAWDLHQSKPEPTPPKPTKSRKSGPQTSDQIVVSLSDAREKKQAESFANNLMNEILDFEVDQYYSEKLTALAVACSSIVRHFTEDNRREQVKPLDLGRIGRRVAWNTLERLSDELTRLTHDTITYDLYHSAKDAKLVAAVEAELKQNKQIAEGVSAKFSAVLNSFADKAEGKKDRLLERASKAAQESEQRYNAAKDSASLIPFGQPILVGHHSERRDRNYRAKIESNFDKSFKAQEKADYLTEKAERLGSGGIQSDDPEAITKLTKKLENCVKAQDIMKKANQLIRSGKESELSSLGLSEDQIKELLAPRVGTKKGFQSYSLSNNNAEIRRLRDRINTIATTATTDDTAPTTHGPATQAITDGRICFTFDGKPSKEIRELVKAEGFKWAPSRAAWVRKPTNNGLYAAKVLARKLEQVEC